jgi:hypothetical protein
MTKFENHKNYNCKITLDNGEEYLVYANWIHNNDLDHWKGWYCSAGTKRFYVDKNFDIWAGECKNEHLGNLLNDWDLSQDSECRRETCIGCTDDLLTEKHKKNA